jgi:hypothetical protein
MPELGTLGKNKNFGYKNLIKKEAFSGLVSFQTIWSIISDQCQITTRAGL